MRSNLLDTLNQLLSDEANTLPYPEEAPDYAISITGEGGDDVHF